MRKKILTTSAALVVVFAIISSPIAFAQGPPFYWDTSHNKESNGGLPAAGLVLGRGQIFVRHQNFFDLLVAYHQIYYLGPLRFWHATIMSYSKRLNCTKLPVIL